MRPLMAGLVVLVILACGKDDTTNPPPEQTNVINVPGDYSTIQAAIDASAAGDTVLVQPGTYNERINFNGHEVIVGSLYITTGTESYVSSTIIDGSAAGTVVTFESGETRAAVLSGFTIQNGNISVEGGGIVCNNSSPTISSNIITGNRAGVGHTGNGGGICCYNYANPLISGNLITDNYSGFLGGGIHVRDFSAPVIEYNVISNNYCEYQGGGLQIRNQSIAVIRNNTVTGNFGVQGGGIYTYQANVEVSNTIFWGDTGQQGDQEIWTGSPNFTYCDVQGGWTGTGNINCDPMFCDPANNNYELAQSSCCLGSGQNGADIGAMAMGCQ